MYIGVMWSLRSRSSGIGKEPFRLDIDLELARRACANLVGLEPAEPYYARHSRHSRRIRQHDWWKCESAKLADLASIASVGCHGRIFEFTVAQGTWIREPFSHPCGTLKVSVIEKESSGRS